MLLAAPATGCRGKSERAAEAAVATPSVAKNTGDTGPASARRSPGPRWLLLGRLVDLGRFEIIQTLSEPPDQEVTLAGQDVGLVRLRDWRIQAFRLSTGERLWEVAPAAPCRNLVPARASVVAGCGDQVVSFALQTGKTTVIDSGSVALDPFVAGDSIVSPHQDGRVDLFDVSTGRRRAARVLPELPRAFHRYLLPDPGSDGVCALGLISQSGKLMTYRAGCYDGRLAPRWSKSLPMHPPRDPIYDVRQLGPRFLVLDDQYSVLDPSLPPGPGRGYLVRWRDGQMTPFDDQTFATVENGAGERAAGENDPFRGTRDLSGSPAVGQPRSAQVVSDDRRAFALITNHVSALAGIDRSSGETSFLVPVTVGAMAKLDVAEGMPVIRTELDNRWVATAHDASTGRILFQDARSGGGKP
jgi:hypothetical protein